MTLTASLHLFRAALNAVLRSPTSFFDTTPLGLSFSFPFLKSTLTMYIGRILSRLSKDQDTLDNELAMTLQQVGGTHINENYVNIIFYRVVPYDL